MDKIAILNAAGIDYYGAMKRFGNKEALYLKFLFRFPDEPMMKNGAEAFDNKDYKTAMEALHTMKGVSANLNIDGLSSLCQLFLAAIRGEDYAEAEMALDRVTACYNTVCQAINEIKNA